MDSSVVNEISLPQPNDSEVQNKDLDSAIKLLKKARKPLIIAGAGIFWSKATNKLLTFANKNKIPVSTTYHARGLFPDDNPLFLGMIGVRGTEASRLAGEKADVIIALGSRLSERTMAHVGKCSIIQLIWMVGSKG